MNTDKTTLYIKDNKGAMREWGIYVDGNTIVIEHGLVNGSLQRNTEVVDHGKAGRTLNEQILSRVASRISKQRDRGYKSNINDAQEKPLNLLGLKKPMLAQTFQKVKNIDYSAAAIQPKLDGNRMLIANNCGELIAYSRNGKEIQTIDHILDEISIPEGTIIDGEIYCHGETLQTIVSWVKRKQDNTRKLRFHAYDVVSNETFFERNRMLESFDLGDMVDLVKTYRLHSAEEAFDIFKHFRQCGYEGAIIRTNDCGYEDGKRSKSLLKLKEWFDSVFPVIDVIESADHWGILKCIMQNGRTFTVSSPGTINNKKEVLKNKHKYIGQKVRVEYANLTKDGIPFHPVATNFMYD